MDGKQYMTYRLYITGMKKFYSQFVTDKCSEIDLINSEKCELCDKLLDDIEALIECEKWIRKELKSTYEIIQHDTHYHMALDSRECEKYFITDGFIERHKKENGYVMQYYYIKEEFLEDFENICLVDSKGELMNVCEYL